MKNHYATLGLLPNAEAVVIKAAYKALAQRYHPDRYRGAPEFAEEKMAELNEAYAVLTHPQRRRAYDREFVSDLDALDDSFAQWIRAFIAARQHGD